MFRTLSYPKINQLNFLSATIVKMSVPIKTLIKNKNNYVKSRRTLFIIAADTCK